MIVTRTRSASAFLLPLLALAASFAAGCAEYSIRDDDLARLERGELAPGEAVFTCHGMLYDLGFPWDFKLRDEIAAGAPARLAIVITYAADVLGVWFNWASPTPGALMADLADRMEELHRATGCGAPLRLYAVGFSAGGEVVVEAAQRMQQARIARAVVLNPSLYAFSPEAGRLTAEGRLGEVICFWSPFDTVTLLAPLGAGEFGMRGGGERIENRAIWNFHFPPLFASGRQRVQEALLDGEPPAPPHTCGKDEAYRRRLAELLRERRSRSR